MPCRATNVNSESTDSAELRVAAGLRRRIRSREIVNSLVESRDRQSRKWRRSEVSWASAHSSARKLD